MASHLNTDEIEAEALRELREENFRKAVEEAKGRIRERQGRSLLQRLFPFTITIQRRK